MELELLSHDFALHRPFTMSTVRALLAAFIAFFMITLALVIFYILEEPVKHISINLK